MTPTLLWCSVIVALAALFTVPMTTAGKDLKVPLDPGEKDRCPVCGMFVSPYPEWVGQVRHSDGTTVFFDGSKDLFRYLLSLDRFAPDKTRRNVAAVFVTNYYDGEVIAARTAFFVAGSNVMGPMGPELVPHRSLEAAQDFARDHHGRRILRFDEITSAMLRATL